MRELSKGTKVTIVSDKYGYRPTKLNQEATIVEKTEIWASGSINYIVKFSDGSQRVFNDSLLEEIEPVFKAGDKVRVVRNTKSKYGNTIPAGVYEVGEVDNSAGPEWVFVESNNGARFAPIYDVEPYTEPTHSVDYIVVKYRDTVKGKFTASEHVMISDASGNLVIRTKNGANVVGVFSQHEGFTSATIESE